MSIPKSANFTMVGLCTNLSFFVGSSLNFASGYIKKRWHTSQKFQLKIRSNKKKVSPIIGLTNLYKMNSSLYFTC